MLKPSFIRKNSFIFDETEFYQECKPASQPASQPLLSRGGVLFLMKPRLSINISFIPDKTDFYQKYKFYFWWNRVLPGIRVLFLMKPSFIRDEGFIFDESFILCFSFCDFSMKVCGESSRTCVRRAISTTKLKFRIKAKTYHVHHF